MGMASTGDTEPGLWSRLPSTAKFVMLFETVLLFFLSFWLYEEWVSNPFMQTYASDLVQGEGSIIAIIASSGVVVGLVVSVVWRRRKSSSLWSRTVGTVAALSPAVERVTEPFHPVVAALKAAISGTGTESQTVHPRGSEEKPTLAQDQAMSSASVQAAAGPLPGTGLVPVGIAIALLRTLVSKANPVPEKAEGVTVQESAGSEKPDITASAP